MADELRETENTDLIDVSDVEPRFEDELLSESGSREFPEDYGEIEEQEETAPVIASLKDRFAAFSIDLIFLYILYWFMMIIFRAVAVGEAAGPIPLAGLNGLIFHGIFLLIALLYFMLFEMAFQASFGKLLCRLSVRDSEGSTPSFFAVFMRNILRPIDVILFPILLGAAIMEWHPWHSRLGDIAASTLVLRKPGTLRRKYAMSADILASASGRCIAFMIDIMFAGAFIAGLALMLNPDQVLASMLIVVFLPVALLVFLAAPEWLTKTSPGKWLLGYSICLEDGSNLDIPSAFLRTIWRIFDANPFGFLTALFSIRKQRPGDSAAGSVIVKSRRELKGLAGFVAILLLSAGTLYAGLLNRDSFLSSNFQINFLPTIDISGFGKSRAPAKPNLMLRSFQFAAGDPTSIRKPSIFKAGETVFIAFEVNGYSRKDSKVWLQEDLDVRYPDNTVGLKLDNINEFNQEVTGEGPIRFENNMALPQGSASGRYTVTITIRDKYSQQELKEQRFFYVTPPETAPTQPLPPPVPAPQAPAAEPAPPQAGPPVEGAQPPVPASPPQNTSTSDTNIGG